VFLSIFETCFPKFISKLWIFISRHKILNLNSFLFTSSIFNVRIHISVVRRNKLKTAFYAGLILQEGFMIQCVCSLVSGMMKSPFYTTRKGPPFVIHSVCLCEILHEQECDSYPLPPKQLVENIRSIVTFCIYNYTTHFWMFQQNVKINIFCAFLIIDLIL